jgi:hypothetical protein
MFFSNIQKRWVGLNEKRGGEYLFCSYCGRNNKDDLVRCKYCHKKFDKLERFNGFHQAQPTEKYETTDSAAYQNVLQTEPAHPARESTHHKRKLKKVFLLGFAFCATLIVIVILLIYLILLRSHKSTSLYLLSNEVSVPCIVLKYEKNNETVTVVDGSVLVDLKDGHKIAITNDDIHLNGHDMEKIQSGDSGDKVSVNGKVYFDANKQEIVFIADSIKDLERSSS